MWSYGQQRPTRPWAFAALAMLLGGGALLIGLAEPVRNGLASGFLTSTIGVSAILVGLHAVRVARWGSRAVRVFGRIGAVCGGLGSALMLYAIVATALVSAGIAVPTLSLLRDGPGVAVPSPVAVPATPSAAPTEPGNADPATVDPMAISTVTDEQRALQLSTSTLVYAIQRNYSAGHLPAVLTTTSSDPNRIIDPAGTVLGPVPVGAKISYTPSPDGRAFNVTIVGARFGSIATFSSDTGIVSVN